MPTPHRRKNLLPRQEVKRPRSYMMSDREYKELVWSRLPFEVEDGGVIYKASELILYALRRLPRKVK